MKKGLGQQQTLIPQLPNPNNNSHYSNTPTTTDERDSSKSADVVLMLINYLIFI